MRQEGQRGGRHVRHDATTRSTLLGGARERSEQVAASNLDAVGPGAGDGQLSSSVATTHAPGRSGDRTFAMAPEPVHRSIAVPAPATVPRLGGPAARSASGARRPRDRPDLESQKETRPVIQAKGSPVRRRRTRASRSSRSSAARADSSFASSWAATNSPESRPMSGSRPSASRWPGHAGHGNRSHRPLDSERIRRRGAVDGTLG